jgi:HPt (histidine-containing phosphotransfer) domain-containing protein
VDAVRRGGIDLIFMDIQMPEMDGYEATAVLRALPEGLGLPIIAMTAHAMAGDLDKCLNAGMNDVVTKPVNVRRFFDALDRWSPAGVAEAGLDPAQEPGGVRAGADMAPGDVPGIDFAAGLRRLSNNAGRYRKLLSDFRLDYVDAAERIDAALADGDAHAAKFRAHALRGVCANLSMPEAERAAAAIEFALEHGEAVTSDALAALAGSIEEVLLAIEAILSSDEDAAPATAIAGIPELRKELRQLEALVNANDFGAAALLEQVLTGVGRQSALSPALLRLGDSLRRFDYAAARAALAEIMRETAAGADTAPGGDEPGSGLRS